MIGQTLNQYSIEKELAVTSTGTVYLAKHLLLKVPRAVKIIHPQLASKDTIRKRIQLAIEAWAKLDNPHFVHIFEAIDTPTAFGFVMDYIAGQTLRDILQNHGKLGISQAIDYFLQIIKALSYTHQHNIFHRKLSPDNIKICRDETIRVLGLGALRYKDIPKITPPNLCVGKVKYMAPEQFQGRYSALSDQYALGIMLYEMLTGQVPYQGKNLVELYKAHSTETPILPQQLNAEIPDNLQKIILRMMAKKAQDRFSSLQDVANAINEAINRQYLSSDQSLSSLISQGHRAMELRNFDSAIYYYSKILSVYGYSANESQEAFKRRNEAFIQLEEDTDILAIRNYFTIALGCFDDEKFDEASQYVKDILKIIRKYPNSSRVRGLKMDIVHEMSDIVNQVQTTLQTNWNKARFGLENAQKLVEEGQYQEALHLLEETICLEPENEIALKLYHQITRKLNIIKISELYCAGHFALQQKNDQEAVKLFEKVLQISPQHQPSQKYLRIAQTNIEQKKKKRLVTEQFYIEAKELYERGQHQEAVDRFQKILSLDENHSEAKTMLMQLQERVDDDQILEKIGLFYNQGIQFYKARHWKEAIACFQKVLNIMNTHKNALKYKKLAEEALRQEEICQQIFSTAVSLFQANRYEEALSKFNFLAQQGANQDEVSRYRRLCLGFIGASDGPSLL